MWWKLWRFEAILNALFDEGWSNLGIPESAACDESLFLEVPAS
ncbi:MAG: hypothetical protein WCK83_12430 [Burkholderiales bacterium]